MTASTARPCIRRSASSVGVEVDWVSAKALPSTASVTIEARYASRIRFMADLLQTPQQTRMPSLELPHDWGKTSKQDMSALWLPRKFAANQPCDTERYWASQT